MSSGATSAARARRARAPRALAAGTLAAFASLAIAGCGEGGEPARPAAANGAPNVLVVMTDDQTAAGWEQDLPAVKRLVAAEGTVFDNNFATTPKCCPSRATYLTGQYGHNHGVLENDPGYPDLRDPASVLPAWLQAAGYRTAHVGKWLNGYADAPGSDGGVEPPPGWDEWDALLSAKYYDYELRVRDGVRSLGQDPSDHADGVISRLAREFLRRAAPERRPFFLSVAYLAPHTDEARPEAGGECGESGFAVPARRDLGAVGRLAGLRRSPGLDEADVSDKPPFVRRQPPSTPRRLEASKLRVGCERAALLSVDRGVRRLLAELRRAGELEDTLIVFTADNGFLHGEHGIASGKALPYDPAVRVPLAIRAPAAAQPGQLTALVGNIDLAPTILDYARAEPCVPGGDCREPDGHSLRPLLSSRDPRWARDRALLTESSDRGRGICAWSSVRTATVVQSEYRVTSGPEEGCGGREAELYDLRADPGELRNLAGERAFAGRLRRLARLRHDLLRCAGDSCR